MEVKRGHYIGIGVALAIILSNIAIYFIFTKNLKLFYFVNIIAIILGALPFMISLIIETEKEKEHNEMFLEFSRNLVESVKAGTPVSKGIINLRTKHFGSLTPYIQKLANQISMGIPVKNAFQNFAKDVNSKVIKRAVTLISEAEKAGGDIGSILDSVAKSVSEIEELKKERRSAIYGMVVQGYIIFGVFIAIILIIQFALLPLTSGVAAPSSGFGEIGVGGFGGGGGAEGEMDISEQIVMPMFFLLLAQSLFTGLIIGKLSEGSFRAGLKHSFIMVALASLIYFGARVFV